MKSSAPWTFFDALETAYAHPPSVDAAPGVWPFWVGKGAEPTAVFAAATALKAEIAAIRPAPSPSG